MTTQTKEQFWATQAAYGLRIYGTWSGNPRGTKENANNCQTGIWRTMHEQQCQFKRGKGADGKFCGHHAKHGIPGGIPASVLLEQSGVSVDEQQPHGHELHRRRVVTQNDAVLAVGVVSVMDECKCGAVRKRVVRLDGKVQMLAWR